jgi:hypothetical protein
MERRKFSTIRTSRLGLQGHDALVKYHCAEISTECLDLFVVSIRRLELAVRKACSFGLFRPNIIWGEQVKCREVGACRVGYST